MNFTPLKPKNPDYEFPIFIEDGHIYKDKSGVDIPPITRIIGGIKEFEGNYTKSSQDWGTARHYICQLWDEGDLDESTITEDLRPALEAWKNFCSLVSFKPLLIEQPLMNQKLRFAGKLDRYGLVYGKPCIVEIKPETKSRRVRYQTAGQQLLVADFGYPVYRRFSVHLSDDGTYELEEYEDWRDMEVFKSLLATHNAQKEIN